MASITQWPREGLGQGWKIKVTLLNSFRPSGYIGIGL